jgi:Cof subfamily protein (haloacid dehalogenase superfamily)
MSEKLPFEGILLVSDMDRTLLTDDFKIPERNIDAINRFIEKGGRFSLATGRSASSAEKYLDKVKTNAPSILSNGASIYDFNTHKIIWNTALPLSAEVMLQKIIDRFPHVGAEVYIDEQIYIVNENEWTKRHIINEDFEFNRTDLKHVPHGWQKILFADKHENLLEVEEFVHSIEHDGCDFVFSNSMYYEVLPKEVSKGTTLKRLAEFLSIEHKNTVGIGDYYNDVDLVKTAGFGAAVEGAPKELVEAAQYVTGSFKNGAVADLIEFIERTPKLFDNSAAIH